MAVWGSFKWCSKKVEPTFTEQKADKDHKKSKDEKGEKGEKAKKDHKKSKDQTEGKKEKKEKKVEVKKEKKEEQTEGGETKDERIERELKEHNDKVKAWLDIEIKFDFEEFKRVYCNAQEGEWPGVFEWLWKH